MTRLVAIGAVVGFVLTVLALALWERATPAEQPRTDLVNSPRLQNLKDQPVVFDRAPMRTGKVMLPVNEAPQAGGAATP